MATPIKLSDYTNEEIVKCIDDLHMKIATREPGSSNVIELAEDAALLNALQLMLIARAIYV